MSEDKVLKKIVLKGAVSKNDNLYLDMFRNCNVCPLRPKVETRIINGKEMEFTRPGRCINYTAGRRCSIDRKKMLDKLKAYYEFTEQQDTIGLQDAVTMEILKDAEMSRNTELMKNRQPGFYTHKFMELAVRSLESLNKQKYGEMHQNVNHNVDWTNAVEEVWKQRKKKMEEKKEND